MGIKHNKRKSRFLELPSYCHCAQPHDYIEVTEWSNGEGYDVEISRTKGAERFSLTDGEFRALNVLILTEEEN